MLYRQALVVATARLPLLWADLGPELFTPRGRLLRRNLTTNPYSRRRVRDRGGEEETECEDRDNVVELSAEISAELPLPLLSWIGVSGWLLAVGPGVGGPASLFSSSTSTRAGGPAGQSPETASTSSSDGPHTPTRSSTFTNHDPPLCKQITTHSLLHAPARKPCRIHVYGEAFISASGRHSSCLSVLPVTVRLRNVRLH